MSEGPVHTSDSAALEALENFLNVEFDCTYSLSPGSGQPFTKRLAELGFGIVRVRRKANVKERTVGRSKGAQPGGDYSNLTDAQKGALARAARGFYLYRRVRYPPRLNTRLDLDDPGIAHPRTIDSLLRRRLIEPDSGANSFRATVEGQAVYARRRRDWFSGVRMFATI